MSELSQKQCVPCTGAIPPLTSQKQQDLLTKIDGQWSIVDAHHLQREWRLKDFREAIGLTNQIGELAEKEGHHPDIHLGWGKVVVTIYTHKIDGLTESDFVLAAKIDQL